MAKMPQSQPHAPVTSPVSQAPATSKPPHSTAFRHMEQWHTPSSKPSTTKQQPSQPTSSEFPETTTLLVDTYDTLEGVRNAIRVAEQARSSGSAVNAIRLDSGDLGELARAARGLLDDAGFPQIRIMASGGLDEHSISQLVDSGAPIDAFGVGTRFGTSADAPYIDSVYKLVEIDGQPSNQTQHLPKPQSLGPSRYFAASKTA